MDLKFLNKKLISGRKGEAGIPGPMLCFHFLSYFNYSFVFYNLFRFFFYFTTLPYICCFITSMLINSYLLNYR